MKITFHALYFEGEEPDVILGMIPEIPFIVVEADSLDEAREELRHALRLMVAIETSLDFLADVIGPYPIVSRETITTDVHSPFLDRGADDLLAMPERPFRLPDHVRFVEDMCALGLTVRLYDSEGSDWSEAYYGPAVVAGDDVALQEVIRATGVRLEWRDIGGGVLVRPAGGELPLGKGKAEEPEAETVN